MGTAGAIFNHALVAGRALNGQAAAPMAAGASGTSQSSGSNGASGSEDPGTNSATISANDFLTLLVTEMQNQDPTADTDPNEYINQLVQVNSLEQLIDINQTLSSDSGAASSSSGAGSGSGAGSSPSTAALQHGASASPPMNSAVRGARVDTLNPQDASGSLGANTAAALQKPPSAGIQGNLGVPSTNAGAIRAGHALDGHARSRRADGKAIALQ